MHNKISTAILSLLLVALVSPACVMRATHPDTSQQGWKELFADDFSNAVYEPGSWAVETGRVLAAVHDRLFWTKEQYGDFILDCECKFDPGANSGILFRTADLDDWIQTGIEVQVLDSYEMAESSKHECGAIYDVLEPKKKAVRPAGEWNRFTITCKGKNINVVLNDVEVIDMNLDKWTEAHKNPDGSKNKFRTAYKDMPLRGHIGFQGLHGAAKVWYRNITIKEL